MTTEAGNSLLKDGYFVYNPSLFQVKLTNSNYAQWRDDISDLLFGLELSHFIDGSAEKPSIPASGATDGQRAAALKWERQDRLLRHSLSASMSDAIRPYIASARTSRAVWTSLEQIFGSKTRSRVIGLKEQLHHISQGDRSVTEYLHQVRQIAEELSHIDGAVGKEDLTLYVLHGLREEFREIESSIHTREQSYEIDELHVVLVGFEDNLRRRNRIPGMASANAAFSGQRGLISSGPNNSGQAGLLSSGPTSSGQSGNSGQYMQPNQNSYYNRGARTNRGGRGRGGRGNGRGYQGKCQICREQGHSVILYSSH